MASCFICGCSGANYRRLVSTGYSTGSWVSKRSYGSSIRNYSGVRSVCEYCAIKLDKSKEKGFAIILIITAICLLFYIGFRL